MTDQELNFRRLKLGNRIRRAQIKFNKERSKKIQQAQDDLVAGRLSLKEFLLSFNRFHEQLQYRHESTCTGIVYAFY